MATSVHYCAALWLLSGEQGRLHTGRGFRLVFLLLATLPISYVGEFGPHEYMSFPFGTLLEMGVALIAYYWGVASGFATDELPETVALEHARVAEEEAEEQTLTSEAV